MLIYLADLTHTTVTLSIDTFPLGIGYIAAYACQHIKNKNIRFKLFRYPEDIFEALDKELPDVVAVSNYCWNFSLGAWVLRYARQKKNDILTLMGGPNFPVDVELQENFMRALPQLDYYLLGDGEETFAKILLDYLGHGLDRRKLSREIRDSKLPSTVMIDPDTTRFVKGEGFARVTNLDSIPSPYQLGFMDQFFDGRLNPMLQTNRGCPFTCTFCFEGNAHYIKVNKFDMDRIRNDLDYIAERVHPSNTLFITDSNFGMFPRDIEIAAYIRDIQVKKGWPKSINCTTGKNNPNGVMKVVDSVSGAIRISSSVQSMNDQVLRNIRRQNIKLDSYADIQKQVRNRNLQSLADLILCLPGETKATHFEGIKKLLDFGVQRILPYQLMLLEGTQINNQETRKTYQFSTKYRVVPRNFGTYRGEKIFEIEEIVVATHALSYQDYLECRRFHLILEAYYKENPFTELIAFINACGITTSDFFFALFNDLDDAPENLKSIFSCFTEETERELFDTRQSCSEFMKAHIDEIMAGKIGGNLLQKYSVKLWFENLNDLVHHAVLVSKKLIHPKADSLGMTVKEIESQLETLGKYLEAIFVNVLDTKDIRARKVVRLRYDISAWKNRNFQGMLKQFVAGPPPARSGSGCCGRDYIFAMEDQQASYVEDKIKAFGSTPQGIGKMLTRMFLKDLRRKVKVLPCEEEKTEKENAAG